MNLDLNSILQRAVRRLRRCGNPAIEYFTRRDLLGEEVPGAGALHALPDPVRILRRQNPDGSWTYRGGNPALRSRYHYNQLETYRMLGELVEKFAFTRAQPAVRRAAGFLFGCQTPEGDFRGIYGAQYSPNYSAGIMELLIKAGYAEDRRIARGFDWLLSMRQDDGGWAIPLRTVKGNFRAGRMPARALMPDRSRPFSHLATGVVLRAFAAHPSRRASPEARAAGDLLAGRFFTRDAYPDRGSPDFWMRVSFPFWFTDIVSALDSLSLIGFTREDPRIAGALRRLSKTRGSDGLFRVKILKDKDPHAACWITLAILRVFCRRGMATLLALIAVSI